MGGVEAGMAWAHEACPGAGRDRGSPAFPCPRGPREVSSTVLQDAPAAERGGEAVWVWGDVLSRVGGLFVPCHMWGRGGGVVGARGFWRQSPWPPPERPEMATGLAARFECPCISVHFYSVEGNAKTADEAGCVQYEKN